MIEKIKSLEVFLLFTIGILFMANIMIVVVMILQMGG